jgi:hypothetical protein
MASVKITQLPNVLGNQINPAVDILPIVRVGADSTDKITVEELGTLFGGGLEGTQYVFVAANGTDVENAAELQAAYDLAVIKGAAIITPTNIPLSNASDSGGGVYNISVANFLDQSYFVPGQTYNVIINGTSYQMFVQGIMSNMIYVSNLVPGLSFTSLILDVLTYPRVTVIAAPGNYNFGISVFTMNTEYIDLVSLDGNRSIVFNAPLDLGFFENGSINITANDVFVKGVDVQTKQFKTNPLLNLLKVENCTGGNNSFGGINAAGTYINCVGGNNSFGEANMSSGTFINCKGGDFSFGGGILSPSSSGIYENCEGGLYSFGGSYGSGISSGTYTNCKSGDYSFGSNGTVSGLFSNCVGGYESWISNQPGGKLTGKLYFSRHTFSQTNPSAGLGGSVVAFITGSNTFIS